MTENNEHDDDFIPEGHIIPPKYSTAKLGQEIRERNIKVINSLRMGEITFEELTQMSDLKEYDHLNKLTALRLLSSLQGWTLASATKAFIAYDIPLNATVDRVKKERIYNEYISALMSSTPGRWQRRESAPKGWPWFGNIITALKEIENVELPGEIRKSTRFFMDGEKPDNRKTQEEPIDNLDDIFGDNLDDGLDEMFEDDDDDDEVTEEFF